MIIDCHGHYTTEPKDLHRFRKDQTEAVKNKTALPPRAGLKMSDDEIRESLEAEPDPAAEGARHRPHDLLAARLRHGPSRRRRERQPGMDADLQRPDPPLRHALPEELHRRLPAAAVAQRRRRSNSAKELERCVNELGFVGCNLNPDPSGGYFNSPPLTDKWWYPLYEKMVELDVPGMVHVSGCANPAMHTTGSYYLNADTMAFMQFILSDLFKDFPKLRLIIPHGGGAVPFHWGRFRGLALNNNKPELTEIITDNIFFDTCVYHQPGIDLLFKVVPVDNILFASEMVGAVKGNDPKTGFGFDDTKRYVEGTSLSAADKAKVFEGNARKVYPRINKKLAS